MWNDLTMGQRAEVIQMAVKNGMRDLNQIRSFYDSSLASPRKYAMGGPEENIITPSDDTSKFTALKKRTEHSTSWFKAHGTPAQKKMATFALNARKWKHGDGGSLEKEEYDLGFLPEVEVTPNNMTLYTYRPFVDNSFKITGHSVLVSPARNYVGESNALRGIDAIQITNSGNNPNYNILTNNCSDATRRALEAISGKKIKPFLFTTPGDVRDFAENELGGITHYKNGRYETTIPISQAEREFLSSNRLAFTEPEFDNKKKLGGPLVDTAKWNH